MKVRVLKLSESKINVEKAFNGDHFEIEGNHGSSKDKKSLFWVFFEIYDQCFNP